MRKVQEYLKEHGYETLTVDGIWGNETRNALYETLGIECDTGVSHFSREEFRCKCGGKYCNGFPAEPSDTLIANLEKIRAHFGGSPVYIISGLRCQTWNDLQTGSSPKSYHRLGRAADIKIPGVSPSRLLTYCKTLSPHYTYICGRSVHIDF